MSTTLSWAASRSNKWINSNSTWCSFLIFKSLSTMINSSTIFKNYNSINTSVIEFNPDLVCQSTSTLFTYSLDLYIPFLYPLVFLLSFIYLFSIYSISNFYLNGIYLLHTTHFINLIHRPNHSEKERNPPNHHFSYDLPIKPYPHAGLDLCDDLRSC